MAEKWKHGAVRLHNEGHTLVVSVEVNGQWFDIIRTPTEVYGSISEIVETSGIEKRLQGKPAAGRHW